MSRHHPSCPDDGAHVHASPAIFVTADWVVWHEGNAIAATGDHFVAARIAELINTHGLADVPDHLPDALVWGPPASGPIVDWRLPTNPTIQERHP
jgi:hypothetical protein